MSLRTALVACGVFVVAIFVLASGAEEPRPAAVAASEFAGKVITITLGDNGGGVFESAVLKNLGDRTFIVATAIDMGNQDWRAGARVWLPVSEIHQLVEYNTLGDARKAYEAAFQNTAPRQRATRKPSDGL